MKFLTHFALKKDFLWDGETVRLKSGEFSYTLPVGYEHYGQLMIKNVFDIFLS